MFSPAAAFSDRIRLARAHPAFLAALGFLGLLSAYPNSAQAAFLLNGDPSYSFGTSAPNAASMAAAIHVTMGIPISVVTTLANENTAQAPVLADSQAPPYYVYGPSARGVVKNLNLNAPIVGGLTSGSLRDAGSEVDPCGDIVERFVVRLFSATQFYDVLVRFNSCAGRGNVTWSFEQVSGPRPSANPTPTPGPTPVPVQLVSTVSRLVHGLAGTFDINLPVAGPSGIECRRNIPGGSYTIIYTFSNPLQSVSSAVVTGGVGRVHDSSIGVDPHQYIVNLVNVANAQGIVVTLNFVQDSLGHASSAVNASLSLLIGDVGGNGNVGSGDVSAVNGQVGHPVTISNFRDDVNHDGVIDSTDVTMVKNQRGAFLP
jgi:hypothetical protein